MIPFVMFLVRSIVTIIGAIWMAIRDGEKEIEKLYPALTKEEYQQLLDRIRGDFTCLHGYIITNRGAQKFLKSVFPIEVQLDWYMSYYARINNMKLYCSSGICSTGGRFTTIQDICLICGIDDFRIKLLYVIMLFLIIYIIKQGL